MHELFERVGFTFEQEPIALAKKEWTYPDEILQQQKRQRPP